MCARNQTQSLKLPEHRTPPIKSKTEYFSLSLRTWKNTPKGLLLCLALSFFLFFSYIDTQTYKNVYQINNHSLESIMSLSL